MPGQLDTFRSTLMICHTRLAVFEALERQGRRRVVCNCMEGKAVDTSSS